MGNRRKQCFVYFLGKWKIWLFYNKIYLYLVVGKTKWVKCQFIQVSLFNQSTAFFCVDMSGFGFDLEYLGAEVRWKRRSFFVVFLWQQILNPKIRTLAHQTGEKLLPATILCSYNYNFYTSKVLYAVIRGKIKIWKLTEETVLLETMDGNSLLEHSVIERLLL